MADYERTGGIEGAVADSAQRAYESLTPAQQAAARRVFTRLTACSDGVDTADRAQRAELTEGKTLAEAADVEAVLEAFAAERLLILAAGTVEISHEILLTAWPLLRDVWLAETHADRIVRTRLDNVAAEWTRNSHDSSYVYTGSLLTAANESASRISADPARHPPLSQAERDFLRASNRAHRRSVHRRQSFIAFLMALALGLASVAILAFLARQDAVRQRDAAAAGELINESEALGDRNPTISKLLSVAAWRIHHLKSGEYAMLAAASSPAIAGFVGHADRVHSVAFSPDGKILASGSYDRTIRLWNVATHSQIGQLTGNAGKVYSVAFSHDGRTLASGGDDGTVRLWDVRSHRQLGQPMDGRDGDINSVALSPDGKTVASGGENGTVRLWDVRTNRQIGSALTGHVGTVRSVVFSPDGNTLASGGDDGTILSWDVATRQPVGYIPSNGHPILSVAFSPDGRTLASGGADGVARLWDVATQQQVRSWVVGSQAFSVAFSPTGKILASGNLDDAVQLWDIATGQPIGSPLLGYAVAFSPDGRTLATGAYDHIVRLWDVTSYTGTATLAGYGKSVSALAFSPQGKTLASGGASGTIQLWRVGSHRELGSLRSRVGKNISSVAFSPDGRTLASGGADGAVRLWDVATRQQIGNSLQVDADPVHSVAFSPDGATLASGGADGTVRLWDVGYLTGTATRLCGSAQRSLTPAEWKQYVPPGLAYRTVCP